MGGGVEPPPAGQAGLDRQQRQAVIAMRARGVKPRAIARDLGLAHQVVRNLIQQHKRRPIEAAPPLDVARLVAEVDAGRVPVLPATLLPAESKQIAEAVRHLIERDALTPMQAAAKLGMTRGRARQIVRRHLALPPRAKPPRRPTRKERQAAALPEIRRLRAQGDRIKDIAAAVRLSIPTVRKLIGEHAITAPERARRAPPREDRPSRTAAVGRYAKPTSRPLPAAMPRPALVSAPLPPVEAAAVADAAVARRYAAALQMLARKAPPSAVRAATSLPLREVFRLQRAAA